MKTNRPHKELSPGRRGPVDLCSFMRQSHSFSKCIRASKVIEVFARILMHLVTVEPQSWWGGLEGGWNINVAEATELQLEE